MVEWAGPVGHRDVVAAAQRLRGVALRTPVMTSRTLDERLGCKVFLKCENLQRAGAFKFRGAYNALALLDQRARARGAVAYSSGNHAQALALAGSLLHVPVTIVMPVDSPAVKLAATRGYGAEVVTYDRFDPDSETREAIGHRLALERGLTLIPPFDHRDVIAGQGTAGLELVEQLARASEGEREDGNNDLLDYVLTPCGGGGLLSGTATAVKGLIPRCRVVGIEPAAGDDATRSFHTRTLQYVDNPDTIADGARTPSLGEITFPLVLERVDEMATVSDDALVETLRFAMERLKLVVEPTGVLGLAALLQGAVQPPAGARVGVIISGGNADLAQLSEWLRPS